MPALTSIALGVGGLAGLAGGVGSYLANKSAGDRAKMLQELGVQEWLDANVPDPELQKIYLQKFVQQGTLDPHLEQAIKADPSAFEKIADNARYTRATDQALSQLENIGNSGGLRFQDEATLQKLMQEGQTNERSNREAINANLARRGLGGSGFDVAAKLEGAQSTADREASNRLEIAAQAQNNALRSIEGAGELGNNLQNSEFNRNAQKAQASDVMNRFNTENLRSVQERNVGYQNAAQAQNLAEKQRVADQNTGLSNQQQIANKGLLQQQYENKLKRAAGVSGQYNQQANTELQQGQNLGNFLSNTGQGLGSIAGGVANYNFWDKQFNKMKPSVK